MTRLSFAVQALVLTACIALPATAEAAGSLSGTVSMRETGGPMHGANVLIVELGRGTLSDDDGSYEFTNVPPGRYHVVSHLDHIFSEEAKTVEIEDGAEASLDFLLSIRAERQRITVTASESHQTTSEAFQDVEAYDSYDLAESGAISIGEALDHQVGTGIAKRSFGPGSSRPIIRGFDGDRVLMMEDGIRTGTLSSQSGDHGEVMNVSQLDRLEVVKGPATLLYSGNAMGGTVNAIGRHHEHHRHPHSGLRGYLSGSGGTTNSLGGGNAGFELGAGRFQLWGYGGGIRSGDYTVPGGDQVFNSRTQLLNSGGGFGWYGDRAFFSAEAKMDRGDYGVPFAQEFHGHHDEDEDHEEGEEHMHEEGEDDDEDEDEDHHEEDHEEIERIALLTRRDSYRVNFGMHNLGGAFESFAVKLSYVDWQHDEMEFFEDGDSAIGTAFQNERTVVRGVVEQQRRGPWSGRFGVWGLTRDYMAEGEESLSPPIDQNALAFFGLQEVEFERFKVQFGGRVETQRYRPAYAERGEEHHDEHDEEGEDEEEEEGDHEGHEHGEEAPDAIDRTFTGASAAIGLHADIGPGSVFVANFAHSYRAPALEELYNVGPHAGNRAFEIGSPSLDAERGNGFDLSLRHDAGRVRGEFNFFYYDFSNFIFPFANGEEVDGLLEIEYTQRNARYTGTEANLDFELHPALWLRLGGDYVDAKDQETGTYLPRIPPLRGRVGLDFRAGRFRLSPELVAAAEQSRTFTNETTTPAYAVLNLKASYTVARTHLLHRFSVNVFNAGNQFYRNHSSFIKDLAPEMGRGVRFTYMLRFF